MFTVQADAEDLARIADGSDRRGVQPYAVQARRIATEARAAAGDLSSREKQLQTSDRDKQLQAFCEWLHGYDLDLIGTVTFSDDYANSHGIYSLKAALDDVARGLHEIPMVKASIRGYRGRYVLAGEWHPSGRKVPHVHLALDSMGVVDPDKVCADLYRYFFNTRGRSRFEPMRDTSTATLYGLKDTIKASEHDSNCIHFKLGRHKALKGRT